MKKISFNVHHKYAAEIRDYLDEKEIESFSVFECANQGFSRDLDADGFPIASFFTFEIFDQAESFLKTLREKFRDVLLEVRISEVDNSDWVAQYIKELKPIIIDSFYIYNDNYEDMPKDSSFVPVKINSALAFGSGDHQTTRACISMLKYLQLNNFKPKDILDMGCGTGVLAICTSKIWPQINITAIDIEEDAVQITKDNFKANGVIGRAVLGSDVSLYGNKEGVDLILCNILKKPLEDLSAAFFDILRNNGVIITSGFIDSQYVDIKNCYINKGFTEINSIRIDDWYAVLFAKL